MPRARHAFRLPAIAVLAVLALLAAVSTQRLAEGAAPDAVRVYQGPVTVKVGAQTFMRNVRVEATVHQGTGPIKKLKIIGQDGVMDGNPATDSATGWTLNTLGADSATFSLQVASAANGTIASGGQPRILRAGSSVRTSFVSNRQQLNLTLSGTIPTGVGANVAGVTISGLISLSLPSADARSATVLEDSANNQITVTGQSPSGANLTFSLAVGGSPIHGAISQVPPTVCVVTVAPAKVCSVTFAYSPFADYNGSDSFQFNVFDGTTLSAPALVSITVKPVNDAPTFTAGTSPVTVVQESGTYSQPWATAILAGPANESTQNVHFVLTLDPPETSTFMFADKPAISPTGVLTFSTLDHLIAFGTATYNVELIDDGGTDDGGDDSSTTTQLTITVTQAPIPHAFDDSALVYEAGMATGSVPSAPTDISTGGISYNFGPDGAAAVQPFTWGTTVGAEDPDVGDPVLAALTSGGQSIVWGLSDDGLTLTGSALSLPVIEIKLTNVSTHAYRVTMLGPLDHPDIDQSGTSDRIRLLVPYTIKDGNGDTDSATFAVAVADDAPLLTPIERTVPSSGQTNLMLILDVSLSMDDPYQGMTNTKRFDVEKAAAIELLDQYDARGDVAVRLVIFSTTSPTIGTTWISVDAAKTAILLLTAGGNTNYSAALATAMAAFESSGKLTPASNVAYFISDGDPTTPVGGLDSAAQAEWEQFLTANSIRSLAFGLGTEINLSFLAPIAFDGVEGTQIAPSQLTDPYNLGTIYSPTGFISGNLIIDSGRGGADVPAIVRTITVDGTIYLFSDSLSAMTISGTNRSTWDSTSHVLAITTVLGGVLAIDLDDGVYTYVVPTLALDGSEVITFVVHDYDGDPPTNSLTINITANPFVIVRDDLVRSSVNGAGASIVIPARALQVNDRGTAPVTASDPITDPVSGTAAFNSVAKTFTFTDDNTDGGTFNYTATSGAFTELGLVTVNRGYAGTPIAGWGLPEILLGGPGGDTIFAYEGDDYIAAGAGTNTVYPGRGNDTIDAAGLSSPTTIVYESVNDGNDTVFNFDNSNSVFGDKLDLRSLFSSLLVPSGQRLARVQVTTLSALVVEIRVDTDGDLDFDLFIAHMDIFTPGFNTATSIVLN